MSPVIFAGCVAMVLSIACLRADNLVPNPGFESGDDGWQIFVPAASKEASPGFLVVSENPHTGANCAKLSATAPDRYAISSKSSIPVTAGEKYRLSAWVRFSDSVPTQPGAPAAYIRAGLFASPTEDNPDPKGHMHIGLDGTMARNTEVGKLAVSKLPVSWQKIEGVIEIPQGVTLLGVSLFVHGFAGSVYWDDVSVEKVPASTAVSPGV
jgi:hypothetical protein